MIRQGYDKIFNKSRQSDLSGLQKQLRFAREQSRDVMAEVKYVGHCRGPGEALLGSSI